MKKTLAMILSLMLAAGAVVSCTNTKEDKKTDTPNVDTEVTTPSKDEKEDEDKEEENSVVKPETPSDTEYTLQGIIDSIYAQKAPLFMYGSIPVDLTDEFSYKTFLGLDDPSVIKEAVVSESMIGAQAYSLVIARVADGVDAKAVAEKMKNGIDPAKWVCVQADDVKVTTYKDLICFCMIDTEYKEDLTADDVITAFDKVMSGEAEYVTETDAGIGFEEEVFEDEFLEEDTFVPEVSFLEGVINDMYAIKAPQFMLMSMPVDLTDEYSYNTYLGLDDPSKIAEAVVSESMIGAQAYSLVVARVAEGVDAKAVAEEMKNGIDSAKWVCVQADDIKTAVMGDLVCFCMIDTEFAPDYTAQDAIDSFLTVTAA